MASSIFKHIYILLQYYADWYQIQEVEMTFNLSAELEILYLIWCSWSNMSDLLKTACKLLGKQGDKKIRESKIW